MSREVISAAIFSSPVNQGPIKKCFYDRADGRVPQAAWLADTAAAVPAADQASMQAGRQVLISV